MKIKAEHPYSGKVYKSMHKKEGRFYVTIIRNGMPDTIRSYAKYVYETNTGKFVPDGMTVDHINNDKSDDRFENLQLLSIKDNIEKRNRIAKKKVVVLRCHCGKIFERRRGRTHLVKGGTVSCCCRSCTGKFTWLSDKDKKQAIKINVIKIIERSVV